jgi:hypothetical protein
VDLGAFYDFIYNHQQQGRLRFELQWALPEPLEIANPEQDDLTLFKIKQLNFQATIEGSQDRIRVEQFSYGFQNYRFGMQSQPDQSADAKDTYGLIAEGYDLKPNRADVRALPAPVKSYGFPDQVNAYYQNAGFLSELVLAFEELFQSIFYLGPLRDYPQPSYPWTGERPRDVGRRGEYAVDALLASQLLGRTRRSRIHSRLTVVVRVAEWLQELDLIDDFSLQPVAPNRKEYEVRVRRSPDAAEVRLMDVGFGVSQILPVLVLCYYAPPGSTLILEQPEIHLHPAVQAGLADVFIDVITERDIQIILESHSEHLLRRLQRRIAEKKLKPDDAALYFTTNTNDKSRLEELDIDPYGNIRNWPENFFGDEMGDLVAMTEAAMRRQKAEAEASG